MTADLRRIAEGAMQRCAPVTTFPCPRCQAYAANTAAWHPARALAALDVIEAAMEGK